MNVAVRPQTVKIRAYRATPDRVMRIHFGVRG